jgi:hypothetical protein
MAEVPGSTRLRFVLALGCALLASAPAQTQNLQPIVAKTRVVSTEIYDAAQWARRVPYELAFPIIARAKLKAYVKDLPLEPPVRERIVALLQSSEFVDEIIPFLIATQELYVPDAVNRPASFDEHFRNRFAPSDELAGVEHSMFQWNPEAEASSAGFGLDSETAARLITVYDALYLGDRDPAAPFSEQLRCDTDRRGAALRTALERSEPPVRSLLAGVLEGMEADSEIADGIRGVLEDSERFESLVISAIEFVDQMVCREYRTFATRVLREKQLREWMQVELEQPRGGRLWDYLEQAAEQRRFGVLIVVDGLQSQLMETLAGGVPDAFVAEVQREYRDGPTQAPTHQKSRPAPTQKTEFLDRFASAGYHHDDYLPFFRGLYANPRRVANLARVGVATTPTISVRNLPIAKTGAGAAGNGGTGIPNFHFVDRNHRTGEERTGRAYYFFGNDALQLDPLTQRQGMRSLFDRQPTLSSFSCAAQYDAAAHVSVNALLNLALGESQRDFAESICFSELNARADREVALRGLRSKLLAKRDVVTENLAWYQLYKRSGRRDDRRLARRLIDRIAALESEGLPQLLVYYNPWPDHFAHFAGPFADEILAPSGELNRLDYWLGRLSAVYERAGVSDRTLFAMAGDHGLAPIFHMLNPETEALAAIDADLVIEKISSDEGEGPKLTHPFRPPSMKGIDVIVASTAGGNYMLDTFVDQQQHWAQQPVREQLEHLVPLRAPETPIDLIDEVYRRLDESLDYMVLREEVCTPAGGVVRVIGPRAGRRADAWIERRGDRVYYRYENADLLGTDTLTPYEKLDDSQRATHRALRERCVVQARREDRASWCNEREWRRLTSFTPRPDSVVQLSHLYDLDHAGTVNLFPRAGMGYNTRVPGRHAGESFHEKNAFVGAWGAPLDRRGARPRIRTAPSGSAAVLIYEFLTRERTVLGEDGWGHRPLTDIH